jgi:hypothetical protein
VLPVSAELDRDSSSDRSGIHALAQHELCLDHEGVGVSHDPYLMRGTAKRSGQDARVTTANEPFKDSVDSCLLRKAVADNRCAGTAALHGKQEADLDTEPVLLVRSLRHPEMLNTRYLRLSPRVRRRPLGVAGCTLNVRFLLRPRRGDFSGSDTRSVYGRIDLTVCAITTKR